MRLSFAALIVVSHALYRNIQRKKQIEKELVVSKQKYQRFFTSVPNGWALHKIIVDANNKPVDYIFLEVNEAYEKLTGLESKNIIGRKVTEVLPGTEKDPADWIGIFGKVALTGEEIQFENYSEAIGRWYNISASCPEKGYFIVVFDDITERRQSEEALRRSERNLHNITSNLAEGIYVFNKQGKIVFMNPEAERLLGWTIYELNEKGPHDLVHFRKADGTPLPLKECNMHEVITSGKLYTSTDEVFVRKDGTVFPISVITSPIIEDGRIIASVTAFRDITERKDIERKLETLAVTDELTGLLNRRGFITFAEKQYMIAVRHNRKLALIYIDLDGLKIINDKLGHEAGDQAIADTADVLRKTFRGSDIVGRIGGDEFAVLLTETSDNVIENVINSHLKNNLNSHKERGGRKFELLLSLGIAYFDPDKPCTLNDLISTADKLMYENKKLRMHCRRKESQ
ncbi:MAG: diguanylate cyclase [Nitrospirae bacterium]|nr:diguanylate cyclase [Nitrospirota bacterium]